MKLIFNARAFTYKAIVPQAYISVGGRVQENDRESEQVEYKRYRLGPDEYTLFSQIGHPLEKYSHEPDDRFMGWVNRIESRGACVTGNEPANELQPNDPHEKRLISVCIHADDSMIASVNFDDASINPTSGSTFAPFQRLLDTFREANAEILDQSTLIIYGRINALADIPFEEALDRMKKPEGQLIDFRVKKSGLDYVL